MSRRTRGWLPVAAALALYLGLTAILLVLALQRTGGEFIYAQDDPYIHLAIARTLAEHGTWGIAPGEFASASSSPAWTLLLAGLWKAGLHAVWIPFALNVICGMCLIVAGGRMAESLLAGSALRARGRHAFVLALVLATPLPALAFIGMEHSLQILLVVLLVWRGSALLASEEHRTLAVAALAAAAVGVRYESLFVVAAVCGILLAQRRWTPAVVIGCAAAVPVLAFGLYSVANGGLVLPNSVLMKSGPARFATVGSGIAAVLNDWVAVLNLYGRPPQLVLTLAALIALLLQPAARLARPPRAVWIAVLFLAASVLHACLVKIEWFFRYEAYLIALGLLALCALAPSMSVPQGLPTRRRVKPHPAILPLTIALALPLAARTLSAVASVPVASGNIYDQQIQMMRFFRSYYEGRPIAVNDIGAIGYGSGAKVLDIVGLASQPVAELKRAGRLDAEAVAGLIARNRVEAIALYEGVFAPILPETWQKVGEWRIEGNVAASEDTVAFFAPSPELAARLGQSLGRFAPALPARVSWVPTTTRIPAKRSRR